MCACLFVCTQQERGKRGDNKKLAVTVFGGIRRHCGGLIIGRFLLVPVMNEQCQLSGYKKRAQVLRHLISSQRGGGRSHPAPTRLGRRRWPSAFPGAERVWRAQVGAVLLLLYTWAGEGGEWGGGERPWDVTFGRHPPRPPPQQQTDFTS